MVEHGEKNSKYFASLEKKRSETKLLSRLKINNKINTKISLVNWKWDTHLIIFGPLNSKLNNLAKNSCERHITEAECINALKNLKKQISSGSDGITVKFYKLLWNDVKEFYINSINYSFQTGLLTDLQKKYNHTLT